MVIDVAAPGQRPSVFVIDDDDDVRAFMRKRLEANNFNVDEADSGEEALRRVDESIDLVIVDLGLPGIDGFTVVRSLRERFTMPIIMVTAAGDEGDRVLGLEIGADDYVVKPFLPREFVARVHAALRRGSTRTTDPAPRQLFTVGDVVLDATAREARRGDQILSMTNREFDLLLFLVMSPRQAFTREQLLRNVWNAEPGWQDPATVTEHVHRLRRLIEVDPAVPSRLVTVRGVGYRFDP